MEGEISKHEHPKTDSSITYVHLSSKVLFDIYLQKKIAPYVLPLYFRLGFVRVYLVGWFLYSSSYLGCQVTTAREKDSPEVWRLLEEIDEKETES